MTPEKAYEALDKLLNDPAADEATRQAWQALDGALKGDAELPNAWRRLTGTTASARAGRAPQQWMNLVLKEYAPPPDGHDDVGRAWWHPATVDAWRRGEWRRRGHPKRTERKGVWQDWVLREKGMDVSHLERRDQIIALCREKGWL